MNTKFVLLLAGVIVFLVVALSPDDLKERGFSN